MENRLLIYIVSYERKSYTQGTIELAYRLKPENSQIMVLQMVLENGYKKIKKNMT